MAKVIGRTGAIGIAVESTKGTGEYNKSYERKRLIWD